MPADTLGFLPFLWYLLTETWLWVLPTGLFLLLALTDYLERSHHHDR